MCCFIRKQRVYQNIMFCIWTAGYTKQNNCYQQLLAELFLVTMCFRILEQKYLILLRLHFLFRDWKRKNDFPAFAVSSWFEVFKLTGCLRDDFIFFDIMLFLEQVSVVSSWYSILRASPCGSFRYVCKLSSFINRYVLFDFISFKWC